MNLVLVPVVVRDAHGRAIGNLTKDDFELFDKRKRQTISSFSMVQRAVASNLAAPEATETTATPPAAEAAHAFPDRFLIYLFDDLNTTFADMATLRASAVRHFERALPPTDRAAVYTFSGRPAVEFTSDRQKLQDAVTKLQWHPAFGRGGMQCPDINYYLADLILNKQDPTALEGLVRHTAACAHVRPEIAQTIAWAAVQREVLTGEQDTRVALRAVARAIRRLAEMPGERLLVLASPGFFAQTPEGIRDTADILDLAARSKVIISGLGARGVYVVEEEADVTGRAAPSKLWVADRLVSARGNNDVMTDLTEGTGGRFYHNNNDLKTGFERVAAVPEFSYVLGFAPASFKADGSFHSLQVRLSNEKGLSVQARRGYYALQHDPEEQARWDVDDAVFARNEISGIPLDVAIQVSKSGTTDARLMVATKVRLPWLHFRKLEGRHRDSLTVISAVFDQDGGYISGTRKTVNLALRDETMAHLESGINVQSDFDMKPGTYLVRVVVREAGGKVMSAHNATVAVR